MAIPNFKIKHWTKDTLQPRSQELLDDIQRQLDLVLRDFAQEVEGRVAHYNSQHSDAPLPHTHVVSALRRERAFASAVIEHCVLATDRRAPQVFWGATALGASPFHLRPIADTVLELLSQFLPNLRHMLVTDEQHPPTFISALAQRFLESISPDRVAGMFMVEPWQELLDTIAEQVGEGRYYQVKDQKATSIRSLDAHVITAATLDLYGGRRPFYIGDARIGTLCRVDGNADDGTVNLFPFGDGAMDTEVYALPPETIMDLWQRRSDEDLKMEVRRDFTENGVRKR